MYKRGDHVRVIKEELNFLADGSVREYPKGSILKVYEDPEEGDLFISVEEPDATGGYVCLFTENVVPYNPPNRSKFTAGDKVRVRYRHDEDDERVRVGNEYTVTEVSEWGDIGVSLEGGQTRYLFPGQLEAVTDSSKVDENAGIEPVESPVMIDVDKVIGIINRGDLDVPEILAYLEGFKEGVNTL